MITLLTALLILSLVGILGLMFKIKDIDRRLIDWVEGYGELYDKCIDLERNNEQLLEIADDHINTAYKLKADNKRLQDIADSIQFRG
jgi:hypothetical protein